MTVLLYKIAYYPISIPRIRGLVKKDEHDGFWSALIGLGLGFIGVTLLSFLSKSECPVCKIKSMHISGAFINPKFRFQTKPLR